MAVRLWRYPSYWAYGLVVMCQDEPDKIIAAVKAAVSYWFGKGAYFVASDATLLWNIKTRYLFTE
jgi:glucosamine--fructose-6-phosphate aminotransferase (isomerizing)